MRIKITEIEANAEELRQSTTLSAGLTQLLRRAFIPAAEADIQGETEEEEDQDE